MAALAYPRPPVRRNLASTQEQGQIMADTPTTNGEGSRPTTDGTVANIGAGSRLDVGKAATGEPNNGPARRAEGGETFGRGGGGG